MSHPLTPPLWWSDYAARTLPAGAVTGAVDNPDAPPLLRTPDAIDAAWLTHALRAGGHAVPAIAAVRVEAIGRGAFDRTVRLAIDYAQPGSGPASLLGKFALQQPAAQRTAILKGLYRREAAAYREVHHHRACRLPPVYFAAADDECLNLLLADIDAAPSNSAFATDAEQGSRREEVAAVLTELAALHGCFARLSPVTAPDWLLRLRDSADLLGAHYRVGLDALLSRCGDALDAASLELIADFADYVVPWHRFERHGLTLTHGDARIDNALLQRSGARTDAVLVNWQLVGLRNPMYDVACLLASSLGITARRAHERALIAQYIRAFEHSGAHYASHEALLDYRFNLYGALLFSVCVAGVLPANERANQFLLTLLQRNCVALRDWDAPNLLRQRLGAP